jgi:hypothetical protein
MKKYTIELPIPQKYLGVALISIVMISIIFIVSFYFYYKNRDIYNYYAMNREEAIDTLQETYANFKKMSGKEFHAFWNEQFHDAQYVLGGNGNGKWDCSNSACFSLKLLGANIQYATTKDLMKMFAEKSYYREKFYDCRIFDVILFHRNRAGVGHVGIIERVDVEAKQLKYCDMNVNDGGPGYHTINFDNPRIYGIFPITLEIWFGELLKKE